MNEWPVALRAAIDTLSTRPLPAPVLHLNTWSNQRLQPEPCGKRGSPRPQQGILGASGIQPGFYPACRTACHVIARLGGAGIAPSSLNGSGHQEQAVHYTGPKGRGHVVYVCRSRWQYGSRHPRLKQDRPR